MQAFVNEELLRKRRQYAKWGNLIGLGMLFGGLFTVARSPALSATLLLVGVVAAGVGSYMASRYVREPRADQLLAKALDGLDKRYTLYSYYLPADHTVFSHHGFTVIDTRPQTGTIVYANGRWSHRTRFRWLKQLVGEPALVSPEKDLDADISALQTWSARQGLGVEIPIHGVIVFTNENARLNIQGLRYPAVTLSELPDLLRAGMGDQAPLSTGQRREIESLLDELVHKA